MSADHRAIGLAMRTAHLEGTIEPVDPAFSRVLAAFPYGRDEVTLAFDALVDVDGRTIGGSISLSDIPTSAAEALEDLGLISTSPDGSRAFTEKGIAMQALLDEYANPQRVWESLIYNRGALEIPAPKQTVPTGDIRNAVETIDHALRLALEATTEDFELWHAGDAAEKRFGDEFSLDPADIAQLEPDLRIAYVARLLRSAALAYGIETEFGSGQLGAPSEWPHSPRAVLIRTLGDVSLGSRS